MEAPPPDLGDLGAPDAPRDRRGAGSDPVRIALVGKYVKLEDAYLSVAEALRHAGFHARLPDRDRLGRLRDAGRRGGARARRAGRRHPHPRRLRRARDRGQDHRRRGSRASRRSRSSASASACRSRSRSSRATSSAWTARTRPSSTPRRRSRSSTSCPSRRRSPTWAARCASGADPVKLHDDTRARELYGEAVIYERHRHRYEVNNLLRKRLEAAGLVISGTSPDDRLVEVIELPDHPFFVASQYHPEFKSRPERPAPLFREFVGAALEPRARAAAAGRDRRAHARPRPARA